MIQGFLPVEQFDGGFRSKSCCGNKINLLQIVDLLIHTSKDLNPGAFRHQPEFDIVDSDAVKMGSGKNWAKANQTRKE